MGTSSPFTTASVTEGLARTGDLAGAPAEADPAVEYRPLGIHLAGSLPLASADEVFRTVSGVVGDRLRRIPDGETGARADWIVWQYPVLSSRPQFEVAPPTEDFYRFLPRLKLREGVADEDLIFGALGYADAARSSFRVFRELKRTGVIPGHCRFQVCLPTPLAPISAFVAPVDQARVEPRYAQALFAELEQLFDAIPHDQLALQWDTNFEFGMLEGDLRAWFPDVKGGVLERLIGLARVVPADVELGFHFCYGDGKDLRRGPPRDLSWLVEIANALCASVGRTVEWIHMPAAGAPGDTAFYEPLGHLRIDQTELFLGLLDLDAPDAVVAERIATAHELVEEFGIASPCGCGRMAPARLPGLLDAHLRHSRRLATRSEPPARMQWPEGVARIPDEAWVDQPVEQFGLQYDSVDGHGWYGNLDPTVEHLAGVLRDGDVLIDYSGGTGILADRLLRRIYDRQVGLIIVDSSPKFLRVALDRFAADERVAFRRLHFLTDQQRLQRLDEVIEPQLRADVIASTNAIHLYQDLDDAIGAWARVLKPGGRVCINSGNLRNPEARSAEWIIDETVYVIHEVATGIVRTVPRFERYRAALNDPERMARYLGYRDRVFLAPRPLEHYVAALQAAGLEIEAVSDRPIQAEVGEWFEFLSAYHDAVLGWVGGTAKVDGVAADAGAVADRLELMRDALEVIFGGRATFQACWTYINARKP